MKTNNGNDLINDIFEELDINDLDELTGGYTAAECAVIWAACLNDIIYSCGGMSAACTLHNKYCS